MCVYYYSGTGIKLSVSNGEISHPHSLMFLTVLDRAVYQERYNTIGFLGILSPYLFAVYVDDLSVMLNLSNTGLNMYNKMLNHIFYADDLCIMSASPAGLQSILNICEKYASDNDIVFNGKKSVCIVFKPDIYKLKSPDIVLDGAKLEYVENAKYLGVILNEKCQDDNDIQLWHLVYVYTVWRDY